MSKSFKTYFEDANYYNDTLHPKFWDDFTFREDILKPILKIVDNFVKDDQHISPEMVEDIQLTGSLANFNYNDHSDLDVHILLDFADINEDESIVKRALDGTYDTTYNLIIMKLNYIFKIFMNLMWLPVYLVYLIIDGLKNLNKKYRR